MRRQRLLAAAALLAFLFCLFPATAFAAEDETKTANYDGYIMAAPRLSGLFSAPCPARCRETAGKHPPAPSPDRAYRDPVPAAAEPIFTHRRHGKSSVRETSCFLFPAAGGKGNSKESCENQIAGVCSPPSFTLRSCAVAHSRLQAGYGPFSRGPDPAAGQDGLACRPEKANFPIASRPRFRYNRTRDNSSETGAASCRHSFPCR